MVATVGATISFGSLIGEVSGRPVFAWPSIVPLYRDLTVGSRGSDVRAVQQALADIGYRVDVDGVFGNGTLDVLTALYRDAGYELPFVTTGVRGLAWRELVGVPTNEGVVEFLAPVGSLLTVEAPLLRVRTTAPSLESQATSVELNQLAVGAEVGVIVSGESPVQSTVLSAGAFATDEETGASGYPIRVAIPDGVTVDASTPVQIRPWAQPAPTTAVPTVALRQEGAASFVLVRSIENVSDSVENVSDEDFLRVDVVVVAQADGWVAIEHNENLPVGTEILVSP